MSIRGSQSTSLANFLNETQLPCVLFTWKEEKYPNKVHKMRRWTLHFWVFPGDDAGVKPVYLSS
jgi:hypothetical protein